MEIIPRAEIMVHPIGIDEMRTAVGATMAPRATMTLEKTKAATVARQAIERTIMRETAEIIKEITPMAPRGTIHEKGLEEAVETAEMIEIAEVAITVVTTTMIITAVVVVKTATDKEVATTNGIGPHQMDRKGVGARGETIMMIETTVAMTATAEDEVDPIMETHHQVKVETTRRVVGIPQVEEEALATMGTVGSKITIGEVLRATGEMVIAAMRETVMEGQVIPMATEAKVTEMVCLMEIIEMGTEMDEVEVLRGAMVPEETDVEDQVEGLQAIRRTVMETMVEVEAMITHAATLASRQMIARQGIDLEEIATIVGTVTRRVVKVGEIAKAEMETVEETAIEMVMTMITMTMITITVATKEMEKRIEVAMREEAEEDPRVTAEVENLATTQAENRITATIMTMMTIVATPTRTRATARLRVAVVVEVPLVVVAAVVEATAILRSGPMATRRAATTTMTTTIITTMAEAAVTMAAIASERAMATDRHLGEPRNPAAELAVVRVRQPLCKLE